MRLKIWGCRGSVATPGPDTTKYGGNTSCVEVMLDDETAVVLDAGTASDLPAELLSTDARAVVVTEPSLEAGARAQIAEKLKAVGFSDVAMLDKPAQPVDTIDPGRCVVAA